MKKKILIFANRHLGFKGIEFLIKNDYPISFVVLASDNDKHIEELVKDHSIPYNYYYKGIQKELAKKFNSGGDWLISFWSSHIIISELINRFSNTLNVHPSLVPLNQGNDCAAWTIRDQTIAGVTIMTINQYVDKGDIYCSQELRYSFPINGKNLYDALLDQCVDFFQEKWSDIYSEKIKPKRQDGFFSYHTRADTNNDRCKKISEVMSLDETIHWILAHDFYPSTTAEIIKNGKKYRLRILVEEIKY